LINVIRYKQSIYYENKFALSYVENSGVNISEYVPAIRKLFSNANVEDRTISVAESIGYGYIHNVQMSALDNIFTRDKDVATIVYHLFAQTKGTYKLRIFESFSPLYWIKLILFLPQNLFAYLGVKSEVIFVKLFQILWWGITPFLIIFRHKIYIFVFKIITK